MAYKKDIDLEFLSRCSDDDLNHLVDCLIYDENKKLRTTEELTSRDVYKQYSPKHSKYWKEIAGELQCYGGNTIANIFRLGEGVLYSEILEDVCNKLKIKIDNKNLSIQEREDKLLITIFEKTITSMDPAQIVELGKTLNIKNYGKLTAEMMIAFTQMAFKLGGVKSYYITSLIVNSVYQSMFAKGAVAGAAVVGEFALGRAISVLAGPIGIALVGGIAVMDIASPAFRVTIPSVIHIASLRKKVELDQQEIDELTKELENELGNTLDFKN
ncbi:DUF3944 domain-containing protein [Ursidibacter arcticus]